MAQPARPEGIPGPVPALPLRPQAATLPTRAGPFPDRGLWAQVIRHARCADSSLHPDAWFPVSIEPAKARQEAAAAIAVCASCLVRGQCLTLSLRHWDIAQHGIWGGLIAADRARLRRRLPADHSQRRETAAAQGEAAALSRQVKAVTPSER
jgi:Transcription factor WhiB